MEGSWCPNNIYIPLILFLFFLLPGKAFSAEHQDPDTVKSLNHEIEIRDKLIQDILNRLQVLEEKLPGNNQQPEKEKQAKDIIEKTIEENQPVANTLPENTDPLSQQLANIAFERTLIERGGLLLPEGVWEIENALSYHHSSSDRVVIDGFTIAPVLVVGDIFNEKISPDTFQYVLTTRVGLANDWQIDARIPYGVIHERVFDATNQENTNDYSGLGDMELSVSHQLRRGEGIKSDILGSLRWKIPTGKDPFDITDESPTLGTGYHSLQASITAVKQSDPVVFFGGASYTYNVSTTKDVGKVQAGNSFGFQLGMALSLNTSTSMSFGWEQRYTRRTKIDGQEVPGSSLNSGSFTMGVSHTFRSGTTIDVSTSIGLTRDAPDAQIMVSFPYRF